MSRIETVAIKDGNSFRMINADRFDPAIHEKYTNQVNDLVTQTATTLATVNVEVGITPELQEVIDETKAECLKVTEENTQLKQQVAVLEQVSSNNSELLSENSRLKDESILTGKALKLAEEQAEGYKAELNSFKNDIAAMQARIAELEAGTGTTVQPEESNQNDYESWTNDQLKEFLASKDIGYKPSATKPELLKLIPKE
ncbi:stress-responsive nuclear envelope protein [Acinetobacter pittii]|nr:Ish1 domain-containing protein [Acinetobacter pittii]MCG5256909.1 stress-responsive nuclear envelope protein [Acinetobacter pittii]MCK0901501.1 stress-responsive nuclear envelope protein [Acinetobacter pittii]MEC6001679.1 stress-responsive nuclear envelope protein [Acinetobacter pittii]